MFLAPNHWMLELSIDEAVAIMFAIAAGELDESELAARRRGMVNRWGRDGRQLVLDGWVTNLVANSPARSRTSPYYPDRSANGARLTSTTEYSPDTSS